MHSFVLYDLVHNVVRMLTLVNSSMCGVLHSSCIRTVVLYARVLHDIMLHNRVRDQHVRYTDTVLLHRGYCIVYALILCGTAVRTSSRFCTHTTVFWDWWSDL